MAIIVNHSCLDTPANIPSLACTKASAPSARPAARANPGADAIRGSTPTALGTLSSYVPWAPSAVYTTCTGIRLSRRISRRSLTIGHHS